MEIETRVYQQRNEELDLPSVIRAWVKNWWIILLCGCILSMWVYMGISVLKRPVYESEATLVITNNGYDTAVYTENAMEKVAKQYQKILSSKALESRIQEDLGVEALPGRIEAGVVKETNLILLKGVAEKPGDAFRIAKSAVENYAQVSDYVISSLGLEVMKAPEVPETPSNANAEIKLALLAFLLGVAGTVFVIGILVIMRDDIKNERQISMLLDTTLFASLHYERKEHKNRKKSILITNPVTSFLYTENIRKMATRFDFKAHKHNHQVVLVTSVVENEGKSTVAANLALALVSRGRKVLLIDGDLKKPSLYKVFQKEITTEMEVGSCLSGKVPLQRAVVRDKNTGLYYLLGTKSYQNSDVLLSSSRMQQIISMARKSVDYIIIDSSPTRITSDAELIAEHSDAILMVVRQEMSRVADINDALDALRKSGAEVLGCVLNAVQTRYIPGAAEYGYHYYGYHGYHGYRGKYDHYYRKKHKAGLDEEA